MKSFILLLISLAIRKRRENYPLADKLSDESYFYKNNGYLYSGVYVLYLIKKHGADAYKRIYTQEDSLDKYLYEGFEKDAVRSLLSECTARI